MREQSVVLGLRRPHIATLLSICVSTPVLAYEKSGQKQAKSLEKEIEIVEVIAATPLTKAGKDTTKLPFTVQSAVAEELERSHVLSLTDFANQRFASVSINSAQGNPLQPDLQYRAFTASPLLGLAQGLSVYQNGVRLNEPLGDAVNWDLIPVSAIAEMNLHGGSNPLFGLNTLGGSLALNMKSGFDFTENRAQVVTGSWGRQHATLESGGNNGTVGYYINVDHFKETGWRDLSESDSTRWYTSLSFQEQGRYFANAAVQGGQSDLTGNGASPVGLVEQDRAAVFTSPDNTDNDMLMASLDGGYVVNDQLQVAGVVFHRRIDNESFNGDASEYELCSFTGGEQALLEDAEEVEELLEEDLDIELDEVCGDGGSFASFDDLQGFITQQALANGLDP